MLEWTGERYLPWIKDPAIAYEHLHRYAYAAQFALGKRVLDLASGEGYGANILARRAASVTGVDIDQNAVRHASAKYPSGNLNFIAGPITRIPLDAPQSFDLIVCFEAIEHIDDHARLLDEVKRLLAPGGLFIVSTPNKAVYSHESEEQNPYHVKELSIEEFRELLGRYFQHAMYLGQRVHSNSNMWLLDAPAAAPVQEFVIARGAEEFEFISNEQRVPLYVIALASDAPVSIPDGGSVLVDETNELLNEKENAIRGLLESRHSQEQALKWKDEQLASRDETIGDLQGAVEWRESQLVERTESLRWRETQVEEMERSIASQQEALIWRAGQVELLEKENAALMERIHATQHRLGLATEQLEAIHASAGWKFIVRIRHLRESLFPEGSLRRRILGRLKGW